MKSKLISITLFADVSGSLWDGSPGMKEDSTVFDPVANPLSRTRWNGSWREALKHMLTRNGGGDFQSGTVRIENAHAQLVYQRGRRAHLVTVIVPESAVNAVNS